MRISRKTVVEQSHVFMQKRVVSQLHAKTVKLLGIRQFTVDEQITHLHKIALLSEFFDRVAPVTKNSLLSVQVSDAAGR